MNRVDELRAEIARIEEAEEQALIDKYKYLIGKCLKRAYSSRELITDVVSVWIDKHTGEELMDLEVTSIYYYPYNEHGSNDFANIEQCQSISDKKVEDIENYIVDKKEFDDFFLGFVEFYKQKYLIK